MNDMLSGIIKDKTHFFPKRVYYSDTDAGGVVYHSRYLDMAEHGRSELIRLLGGDQAGLLHNGGLAFVVRSLSVSYNRPAFLDNLVSVRTRVKKCENFTLLFDQKIYRDEELLAELEVKVGCVSPAEGKPRPIPEEWKSLIREKMLI